MVTYPDELLHDAVAKMLRHDIGRLPVVNRDDPDRVVGYLGRGEILAARMRYHEEEESRSKGPLAGVRNGSEDSGPILTGKGVMSVDISARKSSAYVVSQCQARYEHMAAAQPAIAAPGHYGFPSDRRRRPRNFRAAGPTRFKRRNSTAILRGRFLTRS